jgi:hypothetical protein
MVDKTLFDIEMLHKNPQAFKAEYDKVFQEYENRKARWLEAAKDKPSLYQYLKDNVHNEK